MRGNNKTPAEENNSAGVLLYYEIVLEYLTDVHNLELAAADFSGLVHLDKTGRAFGYDNIGFGIFNTNPLFVEQ